MSIFVTSRAEKEMLEGLGFVVHLERVVGAEDPDHSAVPMPYVISKLLSAKNNDIEWLKKASCERCYALEAVTENRYYRNCEGCLNRRMGSERYLYEEGEEPSRDLKEDMREGIATTRFENDHYRVQLPEGIQLIFDNFADASTRELRDLLNEAVDLKTVEVTGKSLKEITLIGSIPHITKKTEMLSIDEIISLFCKKNGLFQVSKYHMDYEKKLTILGLYLKKTDDTEK